MRRNLISVLMPAYNAENFIAASISSILTQSYQNFELIVINDASTDETERIIRTFKDSRIVYRKNRKRIGLAANRNKALRLAKGEYIAILDADDVADIHRLQTQITFLQEHTSVVVCGSNAEVIDKFGKTIELWKFPSNDMTLRYRFYIQFPLVHSSIMVRHSVLKKANIKYDGTFAPAEDYNFCFQLLELGDAHVIDQNLVKYRVHLNNISKNKQDVVRRILPLLYKREYGKLKCNFSNSELCNMAAFLNPKTASADKLFETYCSFYQLLEKISNHYPADLSTRFDWLLYIHKAMLLQLKNTLFK